MCNLFTTVILTSGSTTNQMSEEERRDYEELRAALIKALRLTENEIISFSPFGDDEDFKFLLSKAKNQKDTIDRINQLLN